MEYCFVVLRTGISILIIGVLIILEVALSVTICFVLYIGPLKFGVISLGALEIFIASIYLGFVVLKLLGQKPHTNIEKNCVIALSVSYGILIGTFPLLWSAWITFH